MASANWARSVLIPRWVNQIIPSPRNWGLEMLVSVLLPSGVRADLAIKAVIGGMHFSPFALAVKRTSLQREAQILELSEEAPVRLPCH